MEYRLSEYSPTERKMDDREGQCNVWYNVTTPAEDKYIAVVAKPNRRLTFTRVTSMVAAAIVPLWHGGTLNSRRATSPLVRLVARDERWETPDPPPGCSPSKLRWNQAKSHCHLYGAQGCGQRQAYI
ncbi:hypothetical protein TNCV_4436191 [Trichonephila clavipes]|nr:hypothetical protein TNCV_4436191 [Trichonephila clavipes]